LFTSIDDSTTPGTWPHSRDRDSGSDRDSDSYDTLEARRTVLFSSLFLVRMPASSSTASHWRIDAGTTQQASVAYDRGYERTLDDYFERTGVVIGKGGFGLVTVVVERATGQQYALKTIKKRLNVPNIAPVKIEQHLSNIDREIKVLKLLRGTLSVALLKGVYEDDESVHIVMEYCRGGELYANISKHGALTETKVATYMRSVLQTLAQCHSHRILHRDVKPVGIVKAHSLPLLLTRSLTPTLRYVPGQLPAVERGRKQPTQGRGLWLGGDVGAGRAAAQDGPRAGRDTVVYGARGDRRV
jgi:hypothetical protein